MTNLREIDYQFSAVRNVKKKYSLKILKMIEAFSVKGIIIQNSNRVENILNLQ